MLEVYKYDKYMYVIKILVSMYVYVKLYK